MTSFRVGRRIFATATADETWLHVFVDESEIAATVDEAAGAAGPGAFEPLRWGQRVRGLRVRLAAAPEDRVRELIADAWRRKASKRLVADFDATSASAS
jgi:hypothetical protein